MHERFVFGARLKLHFLKVATYEPSQANGRCLKKLIFKIGLNKILTT